MSSLLFVTSSLSGAASKSRELAVEFVDAWRKAHPAAPFVTRDLAVGTTPHLSPETLGALMTAPADRTADQQQRVAYADGLIEELEQASVIVLTAPMYNFSIPSTLKAWIDHVARAGRTFRYSERGPEGQLKGKKVYVFSARGGMHQGTPNDFVELYLRGVLAFLGLTDVTFVYAEGLAMGPEPAAKGLAAAHKAVADLAATQAIAA
jgi:FMN-dependent NADH-azoreductase